MKSTRHSWTAGVLLALLHVTLGSATAAPPQGFVSGKVLNAETKEPLPYATVLFERMVNFGASFEKIGGAYTKLDGTFMSKVPMGTYNIVVSYTSYEPATLKSIYVAGSDTSRVATVFLKPAKIQLKTIKVEGEAIRTKEGSMLTKIKNQGTVTEAITSEQISKTTDSNAAEALARVSGATVVGGKYVYVRGLGERYSQTQINGTSVGTPEPNKKVVPLDIFPTELLDNVTVQKTYTPDMDGEFGGSVIGLNTKEFSRNMFRQNVSLGGTETTTNTGRLSYQGGSLDFLGIDDGTRALPAVIKEMAPNKALTLDNFSSQDLATMGKAFEDVWTPHKASTTPNYSYAGLLAHEFQPFGKKTGVLATFSINHGHQNIAKQQNTYGGTDEPTPILAYDVTQSQTSVLWGLNVAGTSQLAEKQKLKFNLLYTQNTDDQSRVSEGMNNDRGSVVRFYDLSYVERGMLSAIVQGSHDTGLLRSNLDWSLSYSDAKRDEPDRRKTAYEQIDSTFQLTGAGDPHPLSRLFGDSSEKDKAAKLSWTIPFDWSERASNFKTGVAYDNRHRISNYRRFGFSTKYARNHIDQLDLTKPAEEQTTDENIDKGIWTIEETTKANDTYSAEQTVTALYGMLDLPLLSWARVVTGGRYEDSHQAVDSQSILAVIGDPGTRLKRDYQDFLPAVNLTFTPTRQMNVRAAYSKTLNRPELREISPFSMDNFETGYLEAGDTSVVEAKIQNYDLRWELYPGPGELLSLGVFYKKLHDPILKYVFPNTGGYAELPTNGVELNSDPGHLSGWEAEARLSFRDMWQGMAWAADLGRAPGLLSRLSLGANYCRVESEVHVVNQAHQIKSVRLAGQSDYSANFGVFYQDKHWDSALLYRSFGPRLYAYAFASIRDIIEYPPQSLDFTVSYGLNRNTRFKLSAENLLNDRVEFKQGDFITQAYETGTTIGLSVSYNTESKP